MNPFPQKTVTTTVREAYGWKVVVRLRAVLLLALLGAAAACGHDVTAPVPAGTVSRHLATIILPPPDTGPTLGGGGPLPPNGPCVLVDTIPLGNGSFIVASAYYSVCPRP